MSKEIYSGGATTSQHVDAEDDDHFNSTTFKLKRTRSLGLLDEFIPEKTELAAPETTSNASDANQRASNVEQASQADKSTKSSDSETPFSPEFLPHDDTDIEIEPSRHVDYFSHQWDVGDISKSWRYIIQKRKNVANSARLENASWRTWAQRRSNLKTINPELLNWSKENDITWLYGPILKDTGDDIDDDHGHLTHSNTATSAVAGDISIPSDKKKSILKKRSVQDVMIGHANLVKLEAIENRLKTKRELQHQQHLADRRAKAHQRTSSKEPPEFDDYDAILEKLNSQYKFSLGNLEGMADHGADNDKDDMSDSDDTVSSISNISVDKKSRHIHFNTEVQQCIAINPDDDDDDYDDEDYEDDLAAYSQGTRSYIYTNDAIDMDDGDDNVGDDDDDDDQDDGGFFLKVRSPSQISLPPPPIYKLPEPSLSFSKTDDSDSISTSNSKLRTIHKLPSTSINWGSDDENEDTMYTSVSHNVNNNTSRGYDYYYDYNTVYTGAPVDVVDLPEDLVKYSNYGNVGDMPTDYTDIGVSDGMDVDKPETTSTFDLASESESDSDEGLSIGTRGSQGFRHYTFPPEQAREEKPRQESVLAINPNYTAGLAKQGTSSGSLSQQFFGSAPINKELSRSFLGEGFGGRSTTAPPKTTSTNILGTGVSFDSDESDDSV